MGGVSVNANLWFLVVYVLCVLCRLVVAGNVFLLILIFVILYAQISVTGASPNPHRLAFRSFTSSFTPKTFKCPLPIRFPDNRTLRSPCIKDHN